MLESPESRQKGSETHKKRRSQAEKVGRRKWIIKTLKRIEERQKQMERRLRMLISGLRELLIFHEDYISLVGCKDTVDTMIVNDLRKAGATGLQSGELADAIGIDHRRISERIEAINKRMKAEIGESIIDKNGHKWILIARLRRDFEVAH